MPERTGAPGTWFRRWAGAAAVFSWWSTRGIVARPDGGAGRGTGRGTDTGRDAWGRVGRVGLVVNGLVRRVR
ncbi:hypothetical protein GCM10018785_32670 [Streptomyces longispororuber]|uniref:Uncharacterized protein n=1 Tax=Streptomyces longispororuber TaxID=68230 RepID=A0A918ZNZ5_9ACTN|nr:hypothetical protein GCM10018785_32670 [Streptomyces longispororuber]